jgi:uncharacterized protein
MNQNILENKKSKGISSATATVSTSNKLRKYWIGVGIMAISVLLFVFMIPAETFETVKAALSAENYIFYWMILVGIGAEIVAGSMGMGYGVICTTLLLLLNVPPVSVSANIHSAETFTSAAGAFSHYKYGNIKAELSKALSIPGAIGAIIGAIALIALHHKSPVFIKFAISSYTLYLGVKIMQNAFRQGIIEKKKTNIPLIATIGGFIDSFGGGGWGPLITGTLIKNGETPRYAIGSSSLAKFVLTAASAFTFLVGGGFGQWRIVAGLLIGGVVTAPLSAMLTTRLPTKKMFIIVGIVVIICSLISISRVVIKMLS